MTRPRFGSETAVSNKMYRVDVKPEARWASTPWYIRAGSRPAAIEAYLSFTGIGEEGDIQRDEIDCNSAPGCPVNHSTRIDL